MNDRITREAIFIEVGVLDQEPQLQVRSDPNLLIKASAFLLTSILVVQISLVAGENSKLHEVGVKR